MLYSEITGNKFMWGNTKQRDWAIEGIGLGILAGACYLLSSGVVGAFILGAVVVGAYWIARTSNVARGGIEEIVRKAKEMTVDIIHHLGWRRLAIQVICLGFLLGLWKPDVFGSLAFDGVRLGPAGNLISGAIGAFFAAALIHAAYWVAKGCGKEKPLA